MFLTHYSPRIFIMFLLFCGDIWSFFLFESDVLHFLASFFIVQIVYFRPLFSTIIALFLLAVESWVIYGIFGLSLAYTVPVTILVLHLHAYFYHPILLPILASLTYSILFLMVRGFILGLPLFAPYTIHTIFATLGIVLFFSLIVHKGKTRQSLIPHGE